MGETRSRALVNWESQEGAVVTGRIWTLQEGLLHEALHVAQPVPPTLSWKVSLSSLYVAGQSVQSPAKPTVPSQRTSAFLPVMGAEKP